MGNFLKSLVGTAESPVTGFLDAVSGILGKVVTDPNAKLQATLEISKAQNDLTMKLAELDAQTYQAQAAVIETEAKSESWITRNWRPIVALMFAIGCLIGFFDVLFGTIALAQKDLVLAIAMEFLGITKICLGGYYFGRTVEKSGPDIVAAWRGTQQK